MTAYCYNSSAVPKIHHSYRPKHLVIVLVFFVLLIMPSSVCAAAISKSYRVDGNPMKGNLVSLDTKQAGTAHLATMDNSSGLLGVVVGQGDNEAFARDTASLLGDEERRCAYAKTGARVGRRLFDPGSCAAAYEAIVRGLGT